MNFAGVCLEFTKLFCSRKLVSNTSVKVMYHIYICINNNKAFLIIIHKYRQKFVSSYICVLYMYQCVDNTIFPAFAFYTLFYCFLNGYFIAIILR